MASTTSRSDDARWRSDAAKVYRSLRDDGPQRALDLAERCFPVPDGPQTTMDAFRKRGYRRVIDAIVWMRHEKVVLSAIPGVDGTVFHLGYVAATVSPLRPLTLFDDPEVVTDKVSQPKEPTPSDSMDVWHGRD